MEPVLAAAAGVSYSSHWAGNVDRSPTNYRLLQLPFITAEQMQQAAESPWGFVRVRDGGTGSGWEGGREGGQGGEGRAVGGRQRKVKHCSTLLHVG